MSKQYFILEHIYKSFETKLKKLNWSGLKISINEESKKGPSIWLNAYDIDAKVYENLNDKIRVGSQLIPRSMAVDTYFVLFIESEKEIDKLKVAGIILQSIRDSRKIEVGEYNWLNNENSPMTIEALSVENFSLKSNLQKQYGRDKCLCLFFKVGCCIDSALAADFVEVKERVIGMVKIDE